MCSGTCPGFSVFRDRSLDLSIQTNPQRYGRTAPLFCNAVFSVQLSDRKLQRPLINPGGLWQGWVSQLSFVGPLAKVGLQFFIVACCADIAWWCFL